MQGKIWKEIGWGGVRMGEEKKGLNQGDIGIRMIVGGFIVMILSVFLVGLLGIVSIILFVISTLSVIIGFIMIMMEKNNDKETHIANINAFQEEYDEYTDKLGIVKSDIQVTLLETGKYSFEVKIPQYVWIRNDHIELFPKAEYYKNNRTSSESKPDVSELKLKSVPINSILYFEEAGELHKYATVSGGGTSLKGALLGYAVAEDVGAIIGSREPIKTTVVSEDDRRVELIYKDKDGNIKNLEFTHDAYQIFKKLLPSKELRRMANLKVSKKQKKVSGKKTKEFQEAKEKLEQLQEMKNEGLITENEFTEQKKKILSSL